MASTTFIIGDRPTEVVGDPLQVQVTLTEVPYGSYTAIQVTLDTTINPLGPADLRGFFFDVLDNSLLGSLYSSPSPSTTGMVTANDFDPPADLPQPSANLTGGGIVAFEGGVQIGTQGVGSGDFWTTATFTLYRSSGDFLLSELIGQRIGIRAMTVPTDDGGQGSSKLVDIVPPPGTPAISIDKVTIDGSAPGDDGITVLAGEDITWQYTVKNTGDVTLSNIVVTDDRGADAIYASGDTDHDNQLDVGETWIYRAAGEAIRGAYTNIGTVTGSWNGQTVTDDDTSGYFGADPGIKIDKVTVDDHDGLMASGDNLIVLANEDITWRYTVTNTGNVALSNVSVTDDMVTSISLISGDDDTDGLLDTNETWVYEATGTAKVGDYSNIGTATGSFTDDAGHNRPVTDDDPSSYFGAKVGINVEKVTNGVEQAHLYAGQAVTWTYTVTNTGNVALDDVAVRDDNGTTVTADDFQATYVSGDKDGDGLLDTDETWTFTAAGTAGTTFYQNTATASGSFTDDATHTATATDSDTSSYTVGPGVRTPGFWANTSWQDFWDGDQSAPKQAGTNGFAKGDVLWDHYSHKDGQGYAVALDPVTNSYARGILVGDWNMDGVTNNGEDTFFFSTQEALNILNASTKTQQDARYILERDVIATWLNYMAGNPIDGQDATKTDAKDALLWAIKWLELTTADENGNHVGDGNLKLGGAVASSSAKWNVGIDGIDGDNLASLYNDPTTPYYDLPGYNSALDVPAGNGIHTTLDTYNNTGKVMGYQIALPDGGYII